MKIRTGFVSNSSSSSFIVAFSNKPTTQDELMKEMFPKDTNGVIENPWASFDEHFEGLSYLQIVEQVFSDLQSQSKDVSKKDLVEELSGRYFVNDGRLYYEGSPYYALDKTLAQKYIDSHEQYESDRKEFDKFEREMIRKHVGPDVPYAYKGGTNWTTKQPCTDEDIKAYEEYRKKVENFEKTNEEYIAAKKKQDANFRKYCDAQRKLANKLAEADLKKFLEDNKGKYIARFTYSDNDGSVPSMMEHGNIFRNLNHITISHH